MTKTSYLIGKRFDWLTVSQQMPVLVYMRTHAFRPTHPKVGIAVRFLAPSYCFRGHVSACSEQRHSYAVVSDVILCSKGSKVYMPSESTHAYIDLYTLLKLPCNKKSVGMKIAWISRTLKSRWF